MSLPQDYVDAINQADRISLVIMGKDPYPSVPTGIPFHKATWQEMQMDSCSGGHVLRSLGLSLDSVTLGQRQSRYRAPRELFLEMAISGIVFLNVSYNFIEESNIVRERHLSFLQNAEIINAPIVDRAWLTFLCGEAKKRRWVDNSPRTSSVTLVHPDIRNRNNTRYPWVSQAWHAWWSQDAIFNWTKPVTELHQALTKLREGS